MFSLSTRSITSVLEDIFIKYSFNFITRGELRCQNMNLTLEILSIHENTL